MVKTARHRTTPGYVCCGRSWPQISL